MFTKGNMIYADAYKYLKHKERNIIALSIQGSAADYEELPMNNPLDVEVSGGVSGGVVFWHNRRFANRPQKMDYSGIKSSIIKNRYSNDDQIAIMLNKDESEEDAMYYQKMQEWREFAAKISTGIMTADKQPIISILVTKNKE